MILWFKYVKRRLFLQIISWLLLSPVHISTRVFRDYMMREFFWSSLRKESSSRLERKLEISKTKLMGFCIKLEFSP